MGQVKSKILAAAKRLDKLYGPQVNADVQSIAQDGEKLFIYLVRKRPHHHYPKEFDGFKVETLVVGRARPAKLNLE